jgi:hypothetical protein
MTTGGAAIKQPVGQPAAGLLPIRNSGPLLDHGLLDLRRLALEAVVAGIRAANAAAAVDRMVHVHGSALAADGHHFDLTRLRSVLILGAGKASAPIAAAMEAKLGDRLAGGLVVSRREASGPVAEGLRRVEIIEADHPVPSLASLAAGRRLMLAAATARPADLVITASRAGLRRWHACRRMGFPSRPSSGCTRCCWTAECPSPRSMPSASTCRR